MATLVCSIGAGDLKEVPYDFNGKRYKTKFAPVALAKLHPKLVAARVLVLVTNDAKQKWLADLTQELASVGMAVTPVDIPDGRTNEEIRQTFGRIAEKIKEREEVYLDVTFSLRHLPFIYLAALTYLTADRGVSVNGIYYGAYELRQDNVVPILEVTELFRLIRWYNALQAAVEDGNLRRLARSLRDDLASLFQSGREDKPLSKAKDQATKLAEHVANGLPLEIGSAAAGLLDAVRQLEPTVSPEYLALLRLKQELEKLASEDGGQVRRLSERELKRQLEVAGWYCEQGDLPKAMLVLREWLVNLTIFRRQNRSRWLEKVHRQEAEAYLNGLSRRAELHLDTAQESEVARLWSKIREFRNRFAHAGMSGDKAKPSQKEVEDLLARCKKLLKDATLFTFNGTRDPLLITPLGLSPGVLTTVLSRLDPPPPRVIVITSAEARERLKEALDRSEASVQPIVRELADPHAGYEQADDLIKDRDLLDCMSRARELIVNLAGGTTVMQYVVERIAREGSRMGISVRRVAAVDRRTPAEQRLNPYRLGELVELDSEASQGEADDGFAT
jgi:CRISPR-associated DxTHG motif protein